MIKFFKIPLIVIQCILLFTSCIDKNSVAGEYSGSWGPWSKIEIILNEDNTYELTTEMTATLPFQVAKKGDINKEYGKWKCNMDYFTNCGDGTGKGRCRELRLYLNNGRSAGTWKVKEGFFGWKFSQYKADDSHKYGYSLHGYFN
jgi:hypothetical protein